MDDIMPDDEVVHTCTAAASQVVCMGYGTAVCVCVSNWQRVSGGSSQRRHCARDLWSMVIE
jgi:hypothetical protein